MNQPNITERQQQWRYHVLAAAAYDGTIVDYAKANNLKTKDIYQWKTPNDCYPSIKLTRNSWLLDC